MENTMPQGHRMLSPYDGVHAWIANEKPVLSFVGETREDWQRWRERFSTELLSLLGKWPERVAPETEVLESVDCGDYVRERIVFDSERYASVPAYVLVPKGIAPGERRPGVLAAHGHGRGKADITCVCDSDEERQHVRALNYDYAVQFARRGWVVIAPDWRGFGERQSPSEWVRAGRDGCNVNYLACGYLGYHLLTLQIWDAIRALDVLCERTEVDASRLGVGGLSFGGTMTTYVAALDERIRVACISGYLSTVAGDAMGTRGLGNFCGAQYMPGLLTIGDIPDVAGLIAPRPLIVEMGERDTCFVIDDMRAAYARVERIYRAAGAEDRLCADIHPGAHEWSGRKSLEWFERWL
jgi:dienelactone hydrolase